MPYSAIEGRWEIVKALNSELDKSNKIILKRKYLKQLIIISKTGLDCLKDIECYSRVPFRMQKNLIVKNDLNPQNDIGSEMLCDSLTLEYSCFVSKKFCKLVGVTRDKLSCFYFYGLDDDSRRYIIGSINENTIFLSIPDLSLILIAKRI